MGSCMVRVFVIDPRGVHIEFFWGGVNEFGDRFECRRHEASRVVRGHAAPGKFLNLGL